MQLSDKQKEFWNNAESRWNVKSGATRSGKTYMDYYVIPKRIRAVAGKDGLVVILGNTKGTLQRNIIEPLQNIWGMQLVSDIRSDNTAMLFGEKCYCLGADKINQVNRIRGSSIKYCYGDEVVTWHPDVFNMLKSRLDKSYSKFDGTCNPEGPNHWFHKFLQSDADLFLQQYRIDDNPFNAKEFVENLKKEHKGTIFYDRYILGLWVAAEGIIYRLFADDTERFILKEKPKVAFATIGVDFGGNGSAHAFSCTGFTQSMKEVVTLEEYYRKEIISPTQLEQDFVDFVEMCKSKYKVAEAYCDSAETTLIQGLRNACAKKGIAISIKSAMKKEVNDRVRFYCRLMSSDRYKISKNCIHTIEAFRTALWDSKYITKDKRLDDGTTNIDSLDAQEYSTEPYMKAIMSI